MPWQGSGTNRGRCPAEHRREIPSVHPFIHTSPQLVPAAQRLVQAGSGRTDRRVDRIFPRRSTGHHPLLGPLPKKSCDEIYFTSNLSRNIFAQQPLNFYEKLAKRIKFNFPNRIFRFWVECARDSVVWHHIFHYA